MILCVKVSSVTLQSLGKQFKRPSSFFFNEFHLQRHGNGPHRHIRHEESRQNWMSEERGIWVAGKTIKIRVIIIIYSISLFFFFQITHHSAPHASEPSDWGNDISPHSRLRAQAHGCRRCAERVTWDSCAAHLTEGMFMHDELVGRGTGSRVIYTFHAKREQIGCARTSKTRNVSIRKTKINEKKPPKPLRSVEAQWNTNIEGALRSFNNFKGQFRVYDSHAWQREWHPWQ